ncbi:hypothetical protein LL253_19775, partial [Sphingobium soli]
MSSTDTLSVELNTTQNRYNPAYPALNQRTFLPKRRDRRTASHPLRQDFPNRLSFLDFLKQRRFPP